jgi:hypothetical protein
MAFAVDQAPTGAPAPVHSCVVVILLPGLFSPPIHNAEGLAVPVLLVVPELPADLTAVFKSVVSVQADPFQVSVLPTLAAPGVSPPKTNPLV